MNFGYDLCTVIALRSYECTLSMPQTLDNVKYNIIQMQKAVRIYT